MKAPSKERIGRIGERVAARFLRREGYRILAKNRHCGRYELDLIAKNKECVVFAEVKASAFDDPSEILTRPGDRVDSGKRQRTADAAIAYLREHPTALTPRLDVIEVYLDKKRLKPFKINHIPDAFSVKGRTH